LATGKAAKRPERAKCFLQFADEICENGGDFDKEK